MIYCYVCTAGHETTEFRPVADRSIRRTCTAKGCRRKARRDPKRELEGRAVIADIPEHFNLSTNGVVRSRRHLRQIQKERGLSDYDPKEHGGPPSWWS